VTDTSHQLLRICKPPIQDDIDSVGGTHGLPSRVAAPSEYSIWPSDGMLTATMVTKVVLVSDAPQVTP
jgi:hypothetical protein